MAIKKYKPTSPGRRNSSVIDYKKVLTPDTTPEKSLLTTKKKHAGRNNTGSITVRHKGGGVRESIELLTLKETSMMYQGKLNQLNMIQTDQHSLHY